MWGQKWVWPRSDCISVTFMAQNVLTVVWPETPTVPGMVSPVPDSTLLESIPKGNSTWTHTHAPQQVCMCVISSSHQALHLYSIRASCPECHDALRLVYQINITGCGRHGGHLLCNTYQYALNTTHPLSPSFSPSLLYCCPPFHPCVPLSSHVQNDSSSLCFSCSNLSRRFRRQDVRHGNAVQLCNGLQIDG